MNKPFSYRVMFIMVFWERKGRRTNINTKNQSNCNYHAQKRELLLSTISILFFKSTRFFNCQNSFVNLDLDLFQAYQALAALVLLMISAIQLQFWFNIPTHPPPYTGHTQMESLIRNRCVNLYLYMSLFKMYTGCHFWKFYHLPVQR